MNSYVGYEQSADGGTHHRTIPYPYFCDYLVSPFRLSLRDSSGAGDSTLTP
jgi:hypothetical protein